MTKFYNLQRQKNWLRTKSLQSLNELLNKKEKSNQISEVKEFQVLKKIEDYKKRSFDIRTDSSHVVFGKFWNLFFYADLITQ